MRKFACISLPSLLINLAGSAVIVGFLPVFLGFGSVVTAIEPQPARGPVKLYVSLKGDDSWSGSLDQPNADRTDGPLRSVEHARDVARKRSSHEGGKIILRGGTYELAQTLTFAPQDSGSQESPMVYTSYPGETAVISGGRLIAGWSVGKSGTWTASIPDVKAGKWLFHELFVNGSRRQRARSPNHGFYFVQGQVSAQDPASFRYRGDDVRPEWARSGDVEVVNLNKWQQFRMPIRSVDAASHSVTLSRRRLAVADEQNSRYWIENTLDALDEPGEWYLDAHEGVLYYRPLPGEDHPEKIQFVAPALRQLVRFEGKPGEPVHDMVLRGLTFSDADWSMGADGFVDKQAAANLSAAIEAANTDNCVIEKSQLVHLGEYAIALGMGSKHNTIRGNEFHDLGAGAIKIGDGEGAVLPNEMPQGGGVLTRGRPPLAQMAEFLLNPANYHSGPAYPRSDDENSSGNTIADNRIHDTGVVFQSSVAIWVGQSAGTLISHNEIHNTPYSAISVGWTWGFGQSAAHDNIIEFNQIYNVGQGIMSDMGGIYVLGNQPGTELRNNVIHDVRRYDQPGGYGGWGVYLDSGSSNIRMENNVIYNTDDGGLHANYGQGNTVVNNIFAYGKANQIERSHAAPNSKPLTFQHNIVYGREGSFIRTRPMEGQLRFDFNDYYRAGSQPSINVWQQPEVSWEDWRQRLGQDEHSVISDPKFANPEKGDFSLPQDSPALQVGFKPIDVSQAGPR